MLYADKQNDPPIKRSRYMWVISILYTIFLILVVAINCEQNTPKEMPITVDTAPIKKVSAKNIHATVFCSIPIICFFSLSLLVMGLLNVHTIRKIKIIDMLYADKQNDPHIKRSRFTAQIAIFNPSLTKVNSYSVPMSGL